MPELGHLPARSALLLVATCTSLHRSTVRQDRQHYFRLNRRHHCLYRPDSHLRPCRFSNSRPSQFVPAKQYQQQQPVLTTADIDPLPREQLQQEIADIEMQPERQKRGEMTVAAPVPTAGTKRRKKASKPAAAAPGGGEDQRRTRNPNWVVDKVKTVADMELLLQFMTLQASIEKTG